MIRKRDILYKKLLEKKVVTSREIEKAALEITELTLSPALISKYIYGEYTAKLLAEGKLQKIRKGLYAVLSPLEEPEKHISDKFIIASKIRDRYYLGFHSALEFYGCAYSHYTEVYITILPKYRFSPFKYQNLNFKPIFTKEISFGIETKKYRTTEVKVSSKERTLVDCVDRPDYAGGWEECLKSLSILSGLDFGKIIDILDMYNKKSLYAKVGFVLELLREQSVFYEHLGDETLNKIKAHKPKTPKYLERSISSTLNKDWNLYVPAVFVEYV
jgi:predicted transcriptional regulator of viral defense system